MWLSPLSEINMFLEETDKIFNLFLCSFYILLNSNSFIFLKQNLHQMIYNLYKHVEW